MQCNMFYIILTTLELPQHNSYLFSPSYVQATLEKDRELVKDAGAFLKETMIPKFVQDCLQQHISPLDGEGLTLILHSRGINMRYLGKVAEAAGHREDLTHLRVRI